MPPNFLQSIAQYSAAMVTLLGSLLLLFLAPGLAIGWLKKLLYMSIAVALWILFVSPYQNDLETFAICLLSVFVYKILTEATVTFIGQIAGFVITWRLFTWLFEVDKSISGHPEQAKGFKSSKV